MKKLLSLALALAALAAFANLGAAQEERRIGLPVGGIPCPSPTPINPMVAQNLGPAGHGQNGQYTFQRPPQLGQCCQCLRGALILEFKALMAGTSNATSDAGNDKWYTPGQSGFLWPNSPFPVGQTGTKTITLNPADLKAMCSGTFTIKWQDDTAITKATLQGQACCVTP